MRISEKVHHDICAELHTVPPEKGGILGAKGEVISIFYLDCVDAQSERYAYVPDIGELNAVIAQWIKTGIRFVGMFHSHPYPQTGLSIADKEYIVKIMEAMPNSVSELHFPIIIPGMGMTGHLARRKGEEVIIVPEEIEIVKG